MVNLIFFEGYLIVDNVLVDENKRTSNPRIFAGGDAVRGADLAVTAAADGKKAALAILKDFGISL